LDIDNSTWTESCNEDLVFPPFVVLVVSLAGRKIGVGALGPLTVHLRCGITSHVGEVSGGRAVCDYEIIIT
jgi:hypothetical protein